VDAGDHRTELLNRLKFYYFNLLPIKKPFIAQEIEIRTPPNSEIDCTISDVDCNISAKDCNFSATDCALSFSIRDPSNEKAAGIGYGCRRPLVRIP